MSGHNCEQRHNRGTLTHLEGFVEGEDGVRVMEGPDVHLEQRNVQKNELLPTSPKGRSLVTQRSGQWNRGGVVM